MTDLIARKCVPCRGDAQKLTQEEAQKIRAGTDRERDILLADAYEKEQKIKGEGDARSIEITGRAFSQDADFYAFLKSLEVYQKSFKDKTTILLPSDSSLLRFLQQEGTRGAKADKGK